MVQGQPSTTTYARNPSPSQESTGVGGQSSQTANDRAIAINNARATQYSNVTVTPLGKVSGTNTSAGQAALSKGAPIVTGLGGSYIGSPANASYPSQNISQINYSPAGAQQQTSSGTNNPAYNAAFNTAAAGITNYTNQMNAFSTGLYNSPVIQTSVGLTKGVVDVLYAPREYVTNFAGYAMYGGTRDASGQLNAEKFSAKFNPMPLKQSDFYLNAPITSAYGQVGRIVPSVVIISAGAYAAGASYKNLLSTGLTQKEAFGQMAIGNAESLSPIARYKYSPFTDAGQIARAQNYFKEMNIKTPAIGTRTIEGNAATDVYEKVIKNPFAGTYEQYGVTRYQMISDTRFLGAGSVQQVETIPTMSGRTYIFSSKDVIGSAGNLLPEFNGITPSVGSTRTINTINIQRQGINIKADIFPKGEVPIKDYFGGGTRQISGSENQFVLSKSGPNPVITSPTKIVRGPYDTGTFDFSKTTTLKFSNTGTTMLKIINPVDTTPTYDLVGSGLKDSFSGIKSIKNPLGYTGVQDMQAQSSFNIQPQQTIATSGLAQIPAYRVGSFTTSIPGLSTASIAGTSLIGITSLKPISAVSVLQVPATKQIPTTIPGTYAITKVLQVPKSAQIPAQAQIPSMATATIPALATITTTATIPAFVAPTVPVTGLPLPPIGVPAFFPFGMPLGFDFGMGSRKVKAKGRRKYTPDYAGLLLNRKGKATKFITGAEIRPIPKGFSFNFGSNKLFGRKFL